MLLKKNTSNFWVSVANMSYRATKDDVEDMFSKMDEFIAVCMNEGRTPDKHRSFAFVEIKNKKSFDKAMEFNGTQWMSIYNIYWRPIRVLVSTPRSVGDRSFGNSGNQFGSRDRSRSGGRGGRGISGRMDRRMDRCGFGGQSKDNLRGGNNPFRSSHGCDFKF